MKNLLLTIQYDGSAYHGWQIQANALTVQKVFQNAAEKVFHCRPDVKGCSRTDSGVHANMYCVSLKSDMNLEPENIIRALNGYLPDDIAVLECREVDESFHARYSCRSKEYIYKIHNGKIRDPFLQKYAFHYFRSIDADYLNEQARAFVGTHDFAGFCCSRSDVEDTVRTVHCFHVWREEDMVYFKVEADGFLYNMVRIMVGTLLFVNEGKIKPGELESVIKSKARSRAGKTAPAQGLYLNKINY